MLMQKVEELLEIYFIWFSYVECVRHSFVLSIMRMSVRLGPNGCHTGIHGFTISVAVLTLPDFRQWLLKDGKILSNFCFETSEHSTQTAVTSNSYVYH